jgi:hypothetical protein
MVDAKLPSDRTKRLALAVHEQHLRPRTRLAASLREREMAVNLATSSFVIANSTACRQLAMMDLLVHLAANGESTNKPSVP